MDSRKIVLKCQTYMFPEEKKKHEYLVADEMNNLTYERRKKYSYIHPKF
jgi:hypothetical protein